MAMKRMKDGDIISFNGVAYKYCIGGTCLQCSLRNTRLCDHLKCFNGEHFEVLKDIKVIEMPSEEEFYKVAPSTDKLGGYSLENRKQVQGFQDCWNWIKSKILK